MGPGGCLPGSCGGACLTGDEARCSLLLPFWGCGSDEVRRRGGRGGGARLHGGRGESRTAGCDGLAVMLLGRDAPLLLSCTAKATLYIASLRPCSLGIQLDIFASILFCL